jgi:cell division inhibitor SulA
MAEDERTGVLVLRAWVEAEGLPGLRVRISRTIQGSQAEPVSTASATIDGVCVVVRDWLEELTQGGTSQVPPRDR